MKILCLIDKYYPDASANTVCCENIMEYFKAQGHQVDFVSIKCSIYDINYAEYNGSNVFKIDTYHDKLLKCHGKKFNAKKWMDFPKLYRRFFGALHRIKMLFKRSTTGLVSLDLIKTKDVYNQIVKVNNYYDCIISFSMPFELNIIAKNLVDMGLSKMWYPIMLDPFVFNYTLSKRNIKYRKNLIEKLFNVAKKVFYVEGIKKEEIEKGYNPKYYSKLTEIKLPILKEIKISNSNKEREKKTTLVYAGGFYEKIRNPKEMLKILSVLPEDIFIKIYGSGCEDLINKTKDGFKEGSLFIGGRINHENCLKELSNCDMVLNLGNTISNQMPSKILEYIGMGKPIINFYFIKEDMCLPILEKYPLAININLNDYSQEDIDKLVAFIKDNKGKQLSYEEATKNFKDYETSVVAQKLYKEICDE